MTVKAPLGPHQLRWLKRIRSAGGEVELEISRNGPPIAWVPVEGGKSIRLPLRMYESLVERKLLTYAWQYGAEADVWQLVDNQPWENSDG